MKVKILLMCLGLFVSGANAQSWGPPLYLSAPGQDATHARIAFSGRTIVRSAIWQSFAGENWRIETKKWLSGAWQEDTEILSPQGYDATQPRIAYIIGSPTAIWQIYDAPYWQIQAARQTSQQWGPVQTLSSPGINATAPEIGFRQRTGVHNVVWQAETESGLRIESAAHRGPQGWTDPVILSGERAAIDPKITQSTTTEDGVNVIWTEFDKHNWRVHVARSDGLIWRSAEILSAPGYDSKNPQIAINSQGGTRAAVWQRHDGKHWRIEASRNISLAWQAPEWLSEPGEDAIDAQITYPSSGPVVIWRQFDGTNWRIKSSRFIFQEGIWEKPVTLSFPGRNAINLVISSGFNSLCGITVAIWQSTNEQSSWIEAAARVGVREWGQAEIVSPIELWASQPHMSVDNQSTLATAVWQVHDGVNWRIQTVDRRGSCI